MEGYLVMHADPVLVINTDPVLVQDHAAWILTLCVINKKPWISELLIDQGQEQIQGAQGRSAGAFLG